MATKATPVTKDEFDKDPDSVKEVLTNVPGVGSVVAYFRIDYVDDLTGKPAEDIETVRFAAPSKAVDDEGEIFLGLDSYEIDLSGPSFDKLLKVMEPFVKNGRKVRVATSAVRSTAKSSNPALTEWNRRAKEWARNAGHEVADRGQLSSKISELYEKNNPSDPKPE